MGCVLTGGRYRKTFNTNDLQICANSANSANSKIHTPSRVRACVCARACARVGIENGVSAVSAVSAR